MAPICQVQDAKVFVIIGSRWSVNDQWSEKTVAVLLNEMRMVPGGTVLQSLELVRVRLAWRDLGVC